MHPTVNDNTISGGDRPLPLDSTFNVLASLGVTPYFVYSWLQLGGSLVTQN